MNKYDLAVDTLAGIVGGVASVYVGQPLDTVKVKMQLFPNMYRGMLSCLLNTARQQGMRGFYAGTVPALASNCADNAVTFGTYGQCQNIVTRFTGGDSDTTKLNHIENAGAGCIASLFTSVALCPTELIKIRMQGSSDITEGEKKKLHPSLRRVMSNIWNTNGFKGLFRGFGLTIVREGIGCPLFFGSYEWIRELLKPIGKQKEDCNPLATIVAGAIAGLVTWTVIYPVDVIKSRVQMSEGPSNYQITIKDLQITGLLRLYFGICPTLIKTIPVAGVLLFCVEFSKPIIRKLLSRNLDLPAISSENNFFSLCDFISGWTAGIISTCVGHPTDTIRVIQQVGNTGAINATKEIYKKDKLAGYFKGMMFPLLSMGVINSVYFGVNGNAMRLIQLYRSDGRKTDHIDIRFCCEVENLNKYWHLDVFISGCIGGFCCTFLNVPSEVIKTILQASNISTNTTDIIRTSKKAKPLKITTPIKLVIDLYRRNGIRSLYRGGTLLMLRDVPSMGIYMLTYEHMCCTLMKLFSNENKTKNKIKSIPKGVQIISGGLAGVISWVFVLPLDVLKSKIIADSIVHPIYNSTWDCVIKTYAEGGAKRFFQGFWIVCIRAFPVNGITFLVYEMLMKTCSDRDTNDFDKAPIISKWS